MLRDNEDGEDTKSKFCWAKSVHIEDHVVVNERRTGIGAFVVWNITVETLRVSLNYNYKKISSSGADISPGIFFSNSQALLGIRRPTPQTSTDIPKFRGCNASSTTQERHIQVPAELLRKEESWTTILSQVRIP